MTPEMFLMKRCARCGKIRAEHELIRDRYLCSGTDAVFNPVTKQWAGFQRATMERAEEIYDRRPNIDRATGRPVPFEDAMPQTVERCVQQATVELWTGNRQTEPHA